MGNELQVMRLNIAICDDEKAIREQINELIEKEKAGICTICTNFRRIDKVAIWINLINM